MLKTNRQEERKRERERERVRERERERERAPTQDGHGINMAQPSHSPSKAVFYH